MTKPPRKKPAGAARQNGAVALSRTAWLQRIVVMVITVAVVIIGVRTLVREYTFHRQKPTYVSLEREMAQTMESIKTSAGTPYETIHQQGCGHIANEAGNGALNCNNAYTFTYQVDSVDGSKKLALKILPDIVAFSKGKPFYVPSDLTTITDSLHESSASRLGFGCDFLYQLKDKTWQNETLGQNYKKPISSAYAADFTYTCGGYPIHAVYPVTK